MHLRELSLINFKNYEEAQFSFSKGINCFVGNNGSGKTNVLDAVHYLSSCKSYFNPVDRHNIRLEAPFFVVEGLYDRNGKDEKVYCGVKKGAKKQFKRNKKEYERLADHIGMFPVVIISPYDRDLITEGSEIRRKFIDSVISQSDKQYLDQLISYNKLLAQRNALLKFFAANHTFDHMGLQVYNEQMSVLAHQIFDKRKQFIDVLKPIFSNYYKSISGGQEEVLLHYNSQLHDASMEDLYEKNLQKDMALQYSSVGIHKDDLQFTLSGRAIKKMGSQGQQKSFLVALKLAQFDFVKEAIGFNPILLLDDIFDKLDDSRVEEIVRLVAEHHFGQIFITDTHAGRTEEIVKKLDEDYKMFHISKGALVP